MTWSRPPSGSAVAERAGRALAALGLGVLVLGGLGCERVVYIAQGPEPLDPCAGAPSEWLFCSGFEEGSFDVWDDVDGNPAATNQLLEDPGPGARAGNHVARLLPPPGLGTERADLVRELPPSSGPLWARWFARWEPGFDFTVEHRGSGLHAGSRELLGRPGVRPDGADFFDVLMGAGPAGEAAITAYYPGMYQDCVDPDGACWRDRLPCGGGLPLCSRPEDQLDGPGIALTTARWTCVELRVDPGAPSPDGAGATGSFDFWIDGVEGGPFDDRWLRSTDALALTVLWLNLYMSEEDHPDVGVWLDDVVVSTARIGCDPLGG